MDLVPLPTDAGAGVDSRSRPLRGPQIGEGVFEVEALEAVFWVGIVLGAVASIATYLGQRQHTGPRNPKGGNDVA